MEQSQEINELAMAVNAMQKEPLFALKDSSNPFFKSKYADLSSCWDAARKPLTDNGLCVIQTMDHDEVGNTIIVTTLAHTSGQWMRGRLAIKPVKEDPQGVGSAITYGRRYSLASIIGLCPEDDDGEKATHPNIAPQKIEYITEKQQSEITDMLNATDSDGVKFLRWLKVASLAQMTQAHYEVAMKKLKEKAEAV